MVHMKEINNNNNSNKNCNKKDKHMLIGIDLANHKDLTVRYNPVTKEYAII